MAKIGIQNILRTSDQAIAAFGRAVSTSEQKMFDEVLLLIKELDTTPSGTIKTSIANLKRVQQIRSKLSQLANNKDYLSAVRELVRSFDTLYREQLSYYAVKNQSSVAEQKHKLVKTIARENTIAALTGDGLTANVTAQLDKMLLLAVTTGAKFSDLQKDLARYLVTDDDSQGALSRYANTYAVTALSQYAGQHNKLFTDDLDTDWFEYVGSTIETSRPFCLACTKKRYIHRSEIHDLLAGHIHIVGGEDIDVKLYDKTGLPYGMIEGTTEENFQVNVGDWNCRHQLVPVAKEVVPSTLRRKIAKQLQAAEEVASPKDEKSGGTYDKIVKAIQSIEYAETNRETIDKLRSITEAIEYQPIKQLSPKEGTIFGFSAEKYDYKEEDEVLQNIHLASKIANDKYDVYLVPNIVGSVSADYILRRKNKFIYAEGKITNGKQGIINAINNGSCQSSHIIIDVQMNIPAQTASGQLRTAFQHNKSVMEVWIYKGSRRIIVKREQVESKDFELKFRREWNNK